MFKPFFYLLPVAQKINLQVTNTLRLMIVTLSSNPLHLQFFHGVTCVTHGQARFRMKNRDTYNNICVC